MRTCALLLAAAVATGTLLTAQEPRAVAAAQQYQLRGATVRTWREGDVGKAAVSRDGGRTFLAMPDTDDRLWLRCAVVDPLHGELQPSGALGATATNRLFIVQFATAILPEYRAEMIGRGAEVIGYLPMNAYLVRCDRALTVALRTLPCVRWLGDLPIVAKLDPALAGIAAAGGSDKAAEYNVVLADRRERARVGDQVRDLGGVVTDRCDGAVYLVARLTAAQLAAVAALDTVTWIDRHTGVGVDMDNARIQGGADYIEAVGGFTGQGVRVEITEGFDQTHPDFTNPALERSDTLEPHGHCTAGIVAGNGTSIAQARGMMPDCQLIEGSYIGVGATAHRAMIQGSVDPSLPWQSMLATASWGSLNDTNYTSVSMDLDSALFDFDFVRTQSQGNSGSTNARPEAWAKNVISVGGVYHLNNSNPLDDNWNFPPTVSPASIGPAADGRIKPDIVAYYDAILCSDLRGSAGFNATPGPAGDYFANFGGTSGATPIVAGHVGLLLQMFTDGLWHNPLPLSATAPNRFQNRPHASTAKALLLNTSAQYAFAGVNADLARVHQGWGFPNLQTAYDDRGHMVVFDACDVLQAGQARNYFCWLAPGTRELRATMVYTDPAAQPNAAIHRTNSVDLKLTRFVDGTFWWGNNGLDAGNFSTPGGVANDRDTVENVILDRPAAGIYVARVQATAVPVDGHVATPQLDVDCSLVLRGLGGGFTADGSFQLALASAAPGDVRVTCTGVPATGWTDGFTFFSFNTGRARGYGQFFGLENDFLTTAIFFLPATAGDVFHFTNSAGQYPFATYAFPPAVVLSLSGLQVDGMAMLFDSAGQVAGLSNIERLVLL